MTTTTEYGAWGDHGMFGEVRADVAEFLGEFVGDYDLDGLVMAYQDAITDALPDGVALRGNDFYGPWPRPDDYREVIAAVIDSVDLAALAGQYEKESG